MEQQWLKAENDGITGRAVVGCRWLNYVEW
jgi:hypothetical protein